MPMEEAINQNLTVGEREREIERGYLYLPEEKSASDGSGFQFVKNENSVACPVPSLPWFGVLLQRSFVLKKGRTINSE